jgi:flagellar biosynthesis protein FlhG
VIDQAHNLRSLVRNRPDAAPPRDAEPSHVPVRVPAAVKGYFCRSVAVTSGKGGVGKSNLALMLGLALTNMKKKVLLLDADLGLANIHILLGLAPRHSIAHLIEGTCSVKDIICEGPAGIHIIPGASGLESLANLEPLQLELFIRALSSLEEQYDYLIVDTGAGIGRIATEFCRHADLGLLVLTPEPTSLADAYAMVKVLYEKHIARLSVVVNMAQSEREGREIFDKLNALVIKFLKVPLELAGIVSYDAELPRLIKKQKVVLLEQPMRQVSQQISQCARKICGLPVVKKEHFFSRLFRR